MARPRQNIDLDQELTAIAERCAARMPGGCARCFFAERCEEYFCCLPLEASKVDLGEVESRVNGIREQAIQKAQN